MIRALSLNGFRLPVVSVLLAFATPAPGVDAVTDSVPAPDVISVSNAEVVFSNVPQGAVRESPVRIVNTGDASLSVHYAVSGPGAAVFSVAGGDCDETLAPLAECLLWVGFAPEEALTYSAALTVRGGSAVEPANVALHGTGHEGHFYNAELGIGNYLPTVAPEDLDGVVVAEVSARGGRFLAESQADAFVMEIPNDTPLRVSVTFEYEFPGPWSGHVREGRLRAKGRVGLRASRLRFWSDTARLDDIDLDRCATSAPVELQLQSPRGSRFSWSRGGMLELRFEVSSFENCSFYTRILNDALSGEVLHREWVLRRILP